MGGCVYIYVYFIYVYIIYIMYNLYTIIIIKFNNKQVILTSVNSV